MQIQFARLLLNLRKYFIHIKDINNDYLQYLIHIYLFYKIKIDGFLKKTKKRKVLSPFF